MDNNNHNGDLSMPKMSGKGFPWTTALIGVGALLVMNGLSNKVTLPGLTPDDIALLNTKPETLAPIIKNDTSAVIFTVNGTTMTPAERAEALAKIHQYFGTEMDKLSAKLMVDKDILTNALTAVMALKDGDVREASLKLFFQFFEAWSTLFVNTVLSAGSGIASITASTTSAINDAKTCAVWTFVKKTTYNVDQSTTVVNSVKYSASGTKVLMGLLGSGNSQSSFHQTISTNTMSETQITEFIPHCTSEVIDPDAVFAIMSAHTLSLRPMYDMVQLAANLAPRIEAFVTT